MPTVAHGFFIQPGQESWTNVSDVLADLAGVEPEWRIGAALLLPRRKLAFWQNAVDEWSGATDFILADPESTRMDRAYSERGLGRADYRYLAESDPVANPERFVRNALQAQQHAGATTLVSPWLRHGVTQTEHELSATIAFATLAEAMAGDFDLLMGVEATEGVFGSDEARNAMVNELIEGPELPVYLRMHFSAPAGYGQYRQQKALEGLRDVVRALDANDRPVVMPQAGMLGLLMSGFGARSFGAGMAASLQRNTPPSGGGSGAPPLPWYFVPQLLGFVLAEELHDIADVEGFEVCDCPYCDGALPATGAAFDRMAAGKHFLWTCARLAAGLDEKDAFGSVKRLIDGAVDFADAVAEDGVPLDPRSAPAHLTVWQDVMSD
ncbi:MAG TPA: hypothetical protein VFG42_05715 [Baekduia sp.]|uniref:hypothetical protein n=1 Tax=Baekduia sp. TaxID=2600305 RepID=UPI002D782B9E|nr:hypothetical protein [Baekduia sp.]HET6506264.1 hypothetical protein [Baekduia sp.]